MSPVTLASESARTAVMPKLLFDPAMVDFGDRYEHEIVRTNVLLFNVSNQRVTIQRVGRSCPDCLTTSMDSLTFEPGSTGTLSIALCPDRLPGNFDEMVTIEADGEESLGIPVRARIQFSYLTEGAPFLLTAGSPDDKLVQTVRLTPQFALNGSLVDQAESNEYFSVRVRPDTHASGSYLAEIETASPIPSGMTETILKIPSTDSGDPAALIYASVFLPPPVHVYPGRLRVAPTDREQLRILFIEQRLQPPVQITDVQVPDPSIAWEYLPGFRLEQSRINVYVRNQGGREGPIGDVVLVTSDENHPEIRIPVVVDPLVDNSVSTEHWQVPVANKRGCGCATGM